MIAAIMLALSLTGLRAQPNPEYQFRLQSTVDGATYSTDDNAPKLSMDCLAANGYGQWTISSTPGYAHTTGGATGFNPNYPPGLNYDVLNAAALGHDPDDDQPSVSCGTGWLGSTAPMAQKRILSKKSVDTSIDSALYCANLYFTASRSVMRRSCSS